MWVYENICFYLRLETENQLIVINLERTKKYLSFWDFINVKKDVTRVKNN